MRRIAVINQKGGVGKTTTTANLGAGLAAAGARVLLVDLDPQAHLTMHFGVEPDSDRCSIYEVLTCAQPAAEACVEVTDRVTVVPANIDLAGIEMELAGVVGREVILREAIDGFARGYDYMLIDCPPSLGLLTINALAASREVLIPLQAHFLALQGLSKLLETVTLVRQRINSDLRISGVVLCMYDAGTRLAAEVVEDLTNFLDSSRGNASVWSHARLYRTRIRRNIKLAEAPSYGRTVFDYAPGSNGAVDYADLAREILEEGESSAAGCLEEGRLPAQPTSRRTDDRSVTPQTVAPQASSAPADDTGPLPPGQAEAAGSGVDVAGPPAPPLRLASAS